MAVFHLIREKAIRNLHKSVNNYFPTWCRIITSDMVKDEVAERGRDRLGSSALGSHGKMFKR